MNSDNSGIKYVTRIDYLGPHQISTTGNGSFNINMGNINPALFTVSTNEKTEYNSDIQTEPASSE